MEKVAVNETHKELVLDVDATSKQVYVQILAGTCISLGLIAAIVQSVLRLFKKNKEQNYAYGRIAFDGSNEQIIIEQEILDDSSDSDIDGTEAVEVNK